MFCAFFGFSDTIRSMQRKQVLTYLFLASAVLTLAACAAYKPSDFQESQFSDRIKTFENEEVKVSALPLGAKESKKIFGAPLASKKILPIWLRIENKTSNRTYRFPLRSLDPGYFTAGEAAYISRITPGVRLLKRAPSFLKGMGLLLAPFDYFFVHPANTAMKGHFETMDLDSTPIHPGDVHSGFVFLPLEMGTLSLPIDLYGSQSVQHINLDVQVPGIRRDFEKRDFETLYPEKDITAIETNAEFLQHLESLPCCVTNRAKTKDGDPLNLVVVGELDEVLGAFASAGWYETEIIDLKTIGKMISSFSFGKSYEYAPVSPLYFEGRSHDVALQKGRGSINERIHLRLWLTPDRFQSKPVWVGGVSRDIGVRFTKHAWNLMTHVIDPNLDEVREYVVADLYYSNRLSSFGFVTGAKEIPQDAPAKNLTGDPYYTDGGRVVVLVSKTRLKEKPQAIRWEESNKKT